MFARIVDIRKDMGRVKEFKMMMEEKGDWPYGLEHKFVCTHHFDEPYLNKMIEENGEYGEYDYCGHKGSVCSMQNFMEHVSWKIHMKERGDGYLFHE